MVLMVNSILSNGIMSLLDPSSLLTYEVVSSSSHAVLYETHWGLSVVYGLVLPLPFMLLETHICSN